MCAQLFDRRCCIRCTIARKNFRAASTLLAFNVDQILQRDRDSTERQIHICFFCFGQSGSQIVRQIGANFVVKRVDPLFQRLQHFRRRNFAPPQQVLKFDDAKRRQLALRHSTTLVTMKRLLAWRGALPNACAGVNQSLALSSRKTLKIGTPWAAGSTPSTFTSFNFSA